MSDDQDAIILASRYVAATLKCRDLGDRVKELKEKRIELGEELLETMREVEVDSIKLPDGYSVKRYRAQTKETVNDEFVRVNLSDFFSKHDKPDAPATERAAEATEFIYERRESEEAERLSVRKPPKKKAKAAKSKVAKT